MNKNEHDNNDDDVSASKIKKKGQKEEAEAKALMARLGAQFGDIDLDLNMFGLDNDNNNNTDNGYNNAHDDNELKQVQGQDHHEDTDDDVVVLMEQQQQQQQEKEVVAEKQKKLTQLKDTTSSVSSDTADAKAAAMMMARLGAQFGDLDMSQLGVGVGGGDVGGEKGEGMREVEEETEGIESEESSVAEPTPEELVAWQAAQFSKGKEQKQKNQENIPSISVSVKERRLGLRQKRDQQLLETQMKVRQQQQQQKETTNTVAISTTMTSSSSVIDILNGDSSVFFSTSNKVSLKSLNELLSGNEKEGVGDPEILRSSWKRLYASYENGYGFWNLWNSLSGYDGPTIMILRCIPSESKRIKEKNVSSNSTTPSSPTSACIGFYTTTPWIESTNMYGGSAGGDSDKAFLFSTDESSSTSSSTEPFVTFFPIKEKEKRPPGGYMYCQTSTVSSRQKKARAVGDRGSISNESIAVTGLGVGGKPTQPRLHITENFEDCRCLTYDSSRITTDGDLFTTKSNNDPNHNTCPFAQALYYFDIEELEIWGVGGQEWIEYALKEQEVARKLHIQQYQTIDKKMIWNQSNPK